MTSSNESPTASPPDKPEDQWVKSKSPNIVRGMFASISPTYDALNHALSLNIDKRWRNTLSKTAIDAIRPQMILDVCGGTGDLSISLQSAAARAGYSPLIFCSDFTPEMLQIAQKKFAALHAETTPLPVAADTTRLPFADNQFDLVTVSFGIRNVVDPLAGLKEMARVCRPGGMIAVLEFSKTRNKAIDLGFATYFRHILPFIGRTVTGSRAYSYLSKSVEQFPEGREFCDMMMKATGAPATARRLSFGIATLYTSIKAVTSSSG